MYQVLRKETAFLDIKSLIHIVFQVREVKTLKTLK